MHEQYLSVLFGISRVALIVTRWQPYLLPFSVTHNPTPRTTFEGGVEEVGDSVASGALKSFQLCRPFC